MEISSVLMWIAVLLLLVVAYWYLTVPKNLPPGSAGIPLLGYLPFIGLNVHLTFTNLGKKYGNVYHLYLGGRLAIVLNDYEAIKEALVKQGDVFSGRPDEAIFEEITSPHSGVVLTEGEHWRQHKRFILHNLRDYGVGKPTLEPLLLEEIQFIFKEIKKHEGKPIQIKDFLTRSIANNIHILVTGKRYDYGHPSIREVIQSFKDFEKLSSNGSVSLVTFFPWTKPIVEKIYAQWTKDLRWIKEVNINLVEDVIRDAKSNYIAGQNDYYIQAYLTEREKRLKTNKNESIFTELGLVHNTRDLLIAGTDTSASTLAWAAVYMILYPEIQKKVQAEIDQVIGLDREPSYNDRVNTPYTEAVISEIHRVVSLAPLSLTHRTTKNTNLFGYNIPQDTMVFPNIWAVHNDPKIWGDPENFRPERFIGKTGESMKQYLIPFSIGKRACAGEPLARMEIYLYFVSLLQNFCFYAPPNIPVTSEGYPGFTRQPVAKDVCVKSRK